MSEGPIRREREATRAPVIPHMPKVGDRVRVEGNPLGVSVWQIIAAPSTKLGPSDVITLASGGLRIRRKVSQVSEVSS